MKKCRDCGVELPLTDFYESPSYKDGYRSNCKHCYSCRVVKYQQANNDKVTAKRKEWYERNKAKVLDNKREYYLKNREEILRKAKERKNARRGSV